ncbi:DEAD/DEAH box helicase [Mucilaginibacter sabulilitoris]|uniref:DEAD/DEAH box helicase n=1 Tax=Mucilaginibacter sabulilitoris TaxID=1173583 RepID=A0ABZ0TJI8_9SPHI|nr:DEAD/DEAH box helicase [Mucilaginibacter sabulilitoris]WPU91879.1 DEAD/DEAH box helicase [Mucilaginibacter sabulilitoris]
MFELLAEPIRKYVRDQRWESLRPIQEAAIRHITESDKHLILASRTASGKTEAAFLPVLSKANFAVPGVKVLYISPLIALINDQFVRVEQLCDYLAIPVTKWHGEANRSAKERLVRSPEGVVLITPESIEAMLANSPYKAKALFETLDFVIIDEIHSFLGTDRGLQLKSLLSRLQTLNKSQFRIVGLSATIGRDNYIYAKRLTGQEDKAVVLADTTAKKSEASIRYFSGTVTELPLALMKDLYLSVSDQKVLIFPNSRGRAEEVAVKLKKIAERVKGHTYHFSHHSSIDKEIREYVEHFAKNNERNPFTIACTSTLELGIDIGSVEKVVQIDAAHSIASLIQRIGRSGRRDGEISKLLFYATNEWSLLQTLACLSLYGEGYIEPISDQQAVYDILLHQILSVVRQFNELSEKQLTQLMLANAAFAAVPVQTIGEIISHLIRKGMLEEIGGKLIIGVDAEPVVNNKDFYSVFITEPAYKVQFQDKTIGEVPLSVQLVEDQNILLASRIWKIILVEHGFKKVVVIPATDGKKPLFFGTGGDIHYKIRERMLQLLMENTAFSEMDKTAVPPLEELRATFHQYPIESLEDDRPVKQNPKDLHWYTFQSGKVNRSLAYLFDLAGLKTISDEQESKLILDCSLVDLDLYLQKIKNLMSDLDFHLENTIVAEPQAMSFSKWAGCLPLKYQVELLKEKRYDFNSTVSFLNQVKFVVPMT